MRPDIVSREAFDLEHVEVFYPEPRPQAIGHEVHPQESAHARALIVESQIATASAPYNQAVFWCPATWNELSMALGNHIEALRKSFDEIIVLAVDVPFIPLSMFMSDLEPRGISGGVRIIHVWYSTELIHGMTPTVGRLEAEQGCIDRVNSRKRVHITDVGRFFTRHLVTVYGLRDRPLRFRQGLFLESADYYPFDQERKRAILAQAGIVTKKDIILFAGRADPVKGFDILIDACRLTRADFQLVAILVPYFEGDPNMVLHATALARWGFDYALIPRFDRPLLRALCSSGQTKLLACPSRGEPVGAVPQEAALWAEAEGPVIAVADCDGLSEQVSTGHNGYKFPPNDPVGTTAQPIGPPADARIGRPTRS
jgi:glycosyltransferase involved in cell wall biosynthesis